MKEFIIIDMSLIPSSSSEDIIDNIYLKTISFSAKYKNPILLYKNILLESMNGIVISKEETELTKQFIDNKVELDENIYATIYNTFKDLFERNKHLNMGLKISFIRKITEDEIEIIYTDGSSSIKDNIASYGCCKLLNESQSVNALFDNFTGKNWEFQTFSGSIDNGTNNIGELTGIKVALNNLSSKKIHIIISDSMYSLKSYREYIHVWKNNGYLTYSKKPIKNSTLIKETYAKLQEIIEAGNIVFFKWTEGHANDPFNELCDELAKNEIGINKK